MKKINTYITEKFKISKDINSENTEYIPDEKDYKQVEKIFEYGVYDGEESKKLLKYCKNKTSILKKWLAIMIKTNSTPYKYTTNGRDLIFSLPGNYGYEFSRRGITLYDISCEEFLDAYESIKDIISKENVFKDLIQSYNTAITRLFEPIFRLTKNKLTYELTSDYTKKGIDTFNEHILLNTWPYILVPFKLKYNNKEINCELAFGGYTYYYYNCEGKSFVWSKEFFEEILKKLNIN